MIGCPVEGCKYTTDKRRGMWSHLVQKHPDVVPKGKIPETLKSLGFPDPERPVHNRGKTGRPKKIKTEVTNITNMAGPKTGDEEKMTDEDRKIPVSNELNGLDELGQLNHILTTNGVTDKKAGAIIELFQHYDIDDLKKLQQIMTRAGVNRNSRAMILETWAATRELPDDEIPVEKIGEKKVDSDDDDDEVKLLRDLGLDDSLKDALKAAKRKQAEINVARRLKALNIDPKIYGLPDPPDDPSTKPVVADDDKIEVEWPPDSGKNIKMTPERYNTLLYGWNKAHGKIGNDDEEIPKKKERTIPWYDPYGNRTIEVPAEQYPQYMSITQQYHREKESRSSPEIEEIKKDIKAKDEVINNLIRSNNEREINEAKAQAQYALQKNEELKAQLDKYEKADKLDLYGDAIQKLKTKSEQLLGYGPRALSVQEQSLIKKQDIQAETATTAIKTIADKVKENKLGTGTIVDKILQNFSEPLNEGLRDRIKRGRARVGTAQQPTDEEIMELDAKLQNAEIQQNLDTRHNTDSMTVIKQGNNGHDNGPMASQSPPEQYQPPELQYTPITNKEQWGVPIDGDGVRGNANAAQKTMTVVDQKKPPVIKKGKK